ncbi:electron transfer flavoprotein subunit alpha/FixB family protein [Thalassotalea fonticola]|uniref:Electron transfer flavoprotein subunit alpha/FixB family protein n=1 Tax=Thalassotalea fonticola TaxID=3065649 RepID=A0ABZ0GPV2_9GAMM|nr:electron transfer flavoprotein subunit alpha/FixB family protein [Colwelliaceae bacterium S1-1]
MSELFRRDPRAHWIARNRLHPQHQTLASGPVFGPSGLLRKNPHIIGFIGPNGLKRIDRSGASSDNGQGSRRSASVASEVILPLHQVAEPTFYIVVALDLVSGRLNGHDKDTLGLAQQLANRNNGGGAVVAVAFGELKDDSLDKSGVDRLIHLDGQQYSNYNPEQRCNDLQSIIAELNPQHILLPDSINGGGDLGRRLAAALALRPACGVWKLNDETIICRGSGGKSDITRPLSQLLLVMEECSEPISETRHENILIPHEASQSTDSKLFDHGNISVDPNAIPLGEAGFILSGGNGINDWPQFHHTANVLGATEGASRVAVDDGNMPRERQVGATGTWVTAQVYIAVGISGAIQHMQGIGQCDKVVAINTDEGCDMVKRADLSAIGDSTEILTRLVELVEQRKQLINEGATNEQ